MRVIPVVSGDKAAPSRSNGGLTGGVARPYSKARNVLNSFDFRRAAALTAMTVVGLAMLLFVAGCPPTPGPTATPAIPMDAQDACPLSAATFAGWFQSGSVTLNGVVNPANSLNVLAPNCGFYQWSEQMFLWLNSPAPSAYGGGAHIFDSPTFYDVSPPDASGNRTFIPHTAGVIRPFPIRSAQRGSHGLPVIVDTTGRLFELKPPTANAKAQVRTPSGKLVAIAHVRLENGRPVLLDKESKVIEALHLGKAAPSGDQKQETGAQLAQKFVIDKIPIFLGPSGEVIDVEQGQAGDNSVLEAQTAANGSLVYYATMVNDVYAYFLTGVKNGAITTTTPGQFPTTPADLSSTVAYAIANGKPNPPFPDPNALAIEVKSSWVVAAGLPNLSSYITMTATVPNYDKSNPAQWTPTTPQTVQLALVGMHVVGSTATHPEMVWATFEHVGNDPLATYSYNSTSGPKTVTQNTAGTWVFTANGSGGPFNVAHMSFTGPPTNDIEAATGFTISPSDTLREDPFGIAGSNASSNTEVLSMNDHVLSMLVGGDIRGNYVMTGATWTPFGSNPGPGNLGVGTNTMSNSTMETYAQGSNCFDCHQNITNPTPPVVTTQVSHIFAGLAKLF
jgi:hypothetical protein